VRAWEIEGQQIKRLCAVLATGFDNSSLGRGGVGACSDPSQPPAESDRVRVRDWWKALHLASEDILGNGTQEPFDLLPASGE